MIDPEKFAAQGSEHAIQTAFFVWASLPDVRSKYPELEWCFAIPNGGQRDPKSAAAMKAEGVKSGVHDIMLPVARRGYKGLFIEAKNATGKPSEKQLAFKLFVEYQGYFSHIVNEKTALNCYLSMKKCVEWYLA